MSKWTFVPPLLAGAGAMVAVNIAASFINVVADDPALDQGKIGTPSFGGSSSSVANVYIIAYDSLEPSAEKPAPLPSVGFVRSS